MALLAAVYLHLQATDICLGAAAGRHMMVFGFSFFSEKVIVTFHVPNKRMTTDAFFVTKPLAFNNNNHQHCTFTW